MTDCYRILGVPPGATIAEIRSAYIDRMKRLHPDVGRAPAESERRPEEITAAYWQLRDPARRAEHDRRLTERSRLPTILAGGGGSAIAGGAHSQNPAPSSPPRRGLTLAAASLAILAIAAPAALLYLGYAEPIRPARAGASPAFESVRAVAKLPPRRRPIDAAMRAAAAADFATIYLDLGLPTARDYARRCVDGLVARPSITMLDYCVAFDDSGWNWERHSRGAEASYFTHSARSERYQEAFGGVDDEAVREALQQEIDFIAAGS